MSKGAVQESGWSQGAKDMLALSHKIANDIVEKNKKDEIGDILPLPGFFEAVGSEMYYTTEYKSKHRSSDKILYATKIADRSNGLKMDNLRQWVENGILNNVKPIFQPRGGLKTK